MNSCLPVSRQALLLSALALAPAVFVPSATAADRTWNGASAADSNWSTADNWGGTAPVDGDGLIFDGSARLSNTNDLAAATSFVGITFPATAGQFVLAGNEITLAGNVSNNSALKQTINLPIATTAVRTVTLTTGGGDVEISGAISGTGGGITTAGTGTLTLNGNNSYTGATTIGIGTTVKAGHASALGSTAGAITLNGAASNLDLNGFSVTKGGYNAAAAGGTVTNSSATAAVLTLGTGNAAVNNLSNSTFSGNLQLALTGTGGRTNSNNANTHTGGLFLTSNGATETAAPGWRITNGAFRGTGTLTFGGNAGFTIPSSGVTNWNAFANDVVVSGTGNHWNYQATVFSNGAWTGTGTLSFTNGFTPVFTFGGNMTGFQGRLILLQGGNTFRLSNTTSIGMAGGQVTMRSNTTGNGTFEWTGATNQTVPIGDLNSTGNTGTGILTLRNNATANGTTTFEVGALGLNSTFSGVISNNGAKVTAITKTGSGTWTLPGSHTYTGATAVNVGTLDVSGSLGATACSVASAATLKVANGFPDSIAVQNNATLSMANTGIGSLNVGGAAGVSLGGASAGQKSFLRLDAGTSTSDSIGISNNLNVDAGGVDITISDLGVAANTDYVLATFAAGTGSGFATGTGTTVGAITLTNPNLAFGVTGTLQVDATAIILKTTGAASPATAYWSGAKGGNWSDNTAGQGNFTTTAAGGTFIAANPGAATNVLFTNNTATNLSHSLGGNFGVNSLTYRATSGAVSTGGTHQLSIGAGGITAESGNGGAALGMGTLALSDFQTWTNNSANPLVVTANVSGAGQGLTLAGSGTFQLGGTSFTVGDLAVNADLDLAGTALSAGILDSTGDVTNSSATAASLSLSSTFPSTMSGVISDGAGVVSLAKSGFDSLTLSGANAYSGVTSVTAGTLVIGNADALGTTAGNTTLGTGATLDLNGQTIAEPFGTITGSTITNTSATAAAITGVIGNTGAFAVTGTGDITLGPVKNGAGFVVTKSGANTLTLDNPADNAFARFTLNEGTLLLSSQVGGFKASDDLVVNAGLAKLMTVGGTQGNIYDLAPVTVNGGSFDLNGFSESIGALNGTAGSVVNNAAGTSVLSVGGTASTGSYAGSISDGGAGMVVALTKRGTGIQTLTGTLAYSGDTTVTGGTLSLSTASLSDTAAVSVSAGAALNLTHAGGDIVGSLVLNGVTQPNGLYHSGNSGGLITGTGKIQVGTLAGFALWSSANAGGQGADDDFDLDGMDNGVEYFLGATGSTFTANPQVVGDTVTWPNGGNIASSAYGTEFKVQTSATLGSWTDVLDTDPNLSNTAGSVAYTLPAGAGKLFVRLVVTPN